MSKTRSVVLYIVKVTRSRIKVKDYPDVRFSEPERGGLKPPSDKWLLIRGVKGAQGRERGQAVIYWPRSGTEEERRGEEGRNFLHISAMQNSRLFFPSKPQD